MQVDEMQFKMKLGQDTRFKAFSFFIAASGQCAQFYLLYEKKGSSSRELLTLRQAPCFMPSSKRSTALSDAQTTCDSTSSAW